MAEKVNSNGGINRNYGLLAFGLLCGRSYGTPSSRVHGDAKGLIPWPVTRVEGELI